MRSIFGLVYLNLTDPELDTTFDKASVTKPVDHFFTLADYYGCVSQPILHLSFYSKELCADCGLQLTRFSYMWESCLLGQDVSSVSFRELVPQIQLRRECHR